MPEELQVSRPEAIRPPTVLRQLPEPSDSGPIVLRLRKVLPAEIAAALAALPAFGPPKDGEKRTFDQMARMFVDGDASAEKIARSMIVEPEFSFGDQREEGKAWWGDVTFANRQGLVSIALELAGISAEVKAADPQEEAAAAAVGTFHGEHPGQ